MSVQVHAKVGDEERGFCFGGLTYSRLLRRLLGRTYRLNLSLDRTGRYKISRAKRPRKKQTESEVVEARRRDGWLQKKAEKAGEGRM
jgi:hypothetical protein